MAAFVMLHVPAALLMSRSSGLATVHALATFLFGLRCATTRSIDRVAYLGAYIAGAEVLWRMCDAKVNWEFGKYSGSLVLLVALASMKPRRLPLLPLLFFVLLLPSTVLVAVEYDFVQLRKQVSFYLSGPFSLMVASCFYASLAMSRQEITKLFMTMLAPVAGVSAIALFGIATAESIEFGTESNFATSGDFGPNQVSTTLGLGALFALLCVLIEVRRRTFRMVMFWVAITLATQSALTFSRTGLYVAGLSAFLAMVSMGTNLVALLKSAFVVLLILAIAHFLIIPAVDDFTGGAITERFTERNTSGRDSFMRSDLELWLDYPLMGVGPGGSRSIHGGAASHSEATRLLAEHGLFGLASLLLLGLMAILNFMRAGTSTARGIRAALTGSCLLLIASNGMRLFVPGFLFGLSFVTILPDRDDEKRR